jgi:dTDP-4-amino-4,6-dideoxygalactose transaminase
MKKISLSPAIITESDKEYINDVIQTEVNLDIDSLIRGLEKKFSEYSGYSNAILINSATSGLHLSLLALGVKPGDRIVLPSLTFAATAFAVKYIGAEPVFFDSDYYSWNIDLDLVNLYLKSCAESKMPKVLMPVNLFGRLVDSEAIHEIASLFGLEVISDSAESFGSKFLVNKEIPKPKLSVISFNKNKIITALGGGLVLTNDDSSAMIIRKLANQSRENIHWYEHKQIGYNYRINSLGAILVDSQFERIEHILQKKQWINRLYHCNLSDLQGVEIVKDGKNQVSNKWITNIRFDSALLPGMRDRVFAELRKHNIESRFVWKPLHLQPIFKKNEFISNGNSERIFLESLCLPSGLDITENEINLISKIIINCHREH